ncbi:hypothetical protein HFP69_35320 [Streptomyces sp. ARC12]|uniref:hypothetical protein n=1 Tax=Streptomyces sp. ARC12 TaxID=2724151 RepID=UPI0038573903
MLENVLMNSVFHMSAVMPAVLPFLIRLAAVPDIAVRSDLVELLVVAAELSLPVDADDERQVLLFGRTPITRNASGAGPPSPHTLPTCARC